MVQICDHLDLFCAIGGLSNWGLVQMGVVQMGVVQMGVVQLRVVQMGVVQVQMGVVQMGADPNFNTKNICRLGGIPPSPPTHQTHPWIVV